MKTSTATLIGGTLFALIGVMLWAASPDPRWVDFGVNIVAQGFLIMLVSALVKVKIKF